MSINKLSPTELFCELKKRCGIANQDSENILVVGIVGNFYHRGTFYHGDNLVERFKHIKNEIDLNFVRRVALRGMKHPDRNYRLFFFKDTTNSFKQLEQVYIEDNYAFSKTIAENKDIQYLDL